MIKRDTIEEWLRNGGDADTLISYIEEIDKQIAKEKRDAETRKLREKEKQRKIAQAREALVIPIYRYIVALDIMEGNSNEELEVIRKALLTEFEEKEKQLIEVFGADENINDEDIFKLWFSKNL